MASRVGSGPVANLGIRCSGTILAEEQAAEAAQYGLQGRLTASEAARTALEGRLSAADAAKIDADVERARHICACC